MGAIKEFCDGSNIYDSFASYKVVLIACGIIPREKEEKLEKVLERLGGRIYMLELKTPLLIRFL